MDFSTESQPKPQSHDTLLAHPVEQIDHALLRRARRRPPAPSSGRWPWLIGATVPLALFLLLPLLALLWRTMPLLLIDDLVTESVRLAIRLSLMTSLLTTCTTLLLGTPVAYLLARRRFRGRALLETLIDLPMVLPPAVAGLALLLTFGRRGLVGSYLATLGIELPFTPAAVVMAQTFVAAPFYVKAAMVGFAAVERELEQAAALDGANSWQILRFVTIPLAWSGLFGGLIMTWARALGEFGATIIFAGNFPGRTQTMPLAIYLGFELDLGVALTLSILLLVISFGVLFVVKGLLRREVRVVL
ncbi:MAG TPA: ABC transporter permease [Caldilineaceae bacterium]|nr:ABC transporter permease [Caldilineaceae bacterium]